MFNFTDQLQNVFFIHIYDTDADKFGNTFIEQIKVDNNGKVVTFQESLFACKRNLSKTSRLLRQAATGNCPDRLGWVTARLTTAITCDTDR